MACHFFRTDLPEIRRRPALWIAACLLLAVLTPDADAAPMPALVRAMLNNGLDGAEQRCAYTRTRIDVDGTKSERFDPSNPKAPWSLVSVNGRPPTRAELQRYAIDAGDRQRRHPLAFDLFGMVSDDGWNIRSQTATQAVVEFRLRPKGPLDKRLVPKVLGVLVVDKVKAQPLSVAIQNVAPAYIAPFVRIAKYNQELSFVWTDTLNMSVLSRIETRISGHAFGIKDIQKHKIVRYSDYQCTAGSSSTSAHVEHVQP